MYLQQKIETEIGRRNVANVEIPAYITNNLRHNFFEWQSDAIKYFLTYSAPRNGFKKSPTHLMFNMATGSGKTLLMAAAILYYYKQGYRRFLFFVNANNIVEKTESNFIDGAHSKYLFNDKIVIGDQTVTVKQVNNFSDNPRGIEIKFTTIQKLYNDIHIQRENQTTLDDLHSKKLVMLADEAHHLNTKTKQQTDIHVTELGGRSSTEEIERKGWEHTVIDLILRKNGKSRDNQNVLLEFTATIPEEHSVVKKYQDKSVYRFGLKEFLQAGYTKEINLISSTLGKWQRVLHALLFQWYRHKIALNNDIANFKPVILFRSKTIQESSADYQQFLDWASNLTSTDFDFFKAIANKIRADKQPSVHEMGKSRTEQVLLFIEKEGVGWAEIANWIKQNFTATNVIITNSKTNKTSKEKTDTDTEKLLNNLEDKNNHVRAIFTVQRLTEGWDVLNLFDIVRMYKGRDESAGGGGKRRVGPATTAEKQLIGRGVRYFPFNYQDKIKNKRKFDDDLENELRVLEELYFYSTSEHHYISELKRALKEDGYINDDRQATVFDFKKKFKQTDLFKSGKVWGNSQIDNPKRRHKTLDKIIEEISKSGLQPYVIRGLELREEGVILDKEMDEQRLNVQSQNRTSLSCKIKDFDRHIFLKAVNIKAKSANSLFQFQELTKNLAVNSIDELQTNHLAECNLAFLASGDATCDTLDNRDKLGALLQFLERLSDELQQYIVPKVGGKFKPYEFKDVFGEPKTKNIKTNDLENDVIKDEPWYPVDNFTGTDEEKNLIDFIKNEIKKLKQKYDTVYLVRNEEVYKIYDFEKGRGFQPDFLLFLTEKGNRGKHYQVFIEPKGNLFLDSDDTFAKSKEGWKEQFLKQITKKYGNGKFIEGENEHYKLIGLPFYNEEHKEGFSADFKKRLHGGREK